MSNLRDNLPKGWTIRRWQKAMKACNEAQKMIPLAEMNKLQKQRIIELHENRYKRPDTSDYEWLNDCERSES